MCDNESPDCSQRTGDEDRYARHLVLPAIGHEGQRRLRSACILLVGVGGLGSVIAPYLVGAGVGRIGLVDDDVVSLSNLHRQILYGMEVLGQPKVDVGRRRLLDLNPDVEVISYRERLTPDRAREIAQMYDVVIDGTDNFEARYSINAACLERGIPYVYGAIFRLDGQASVLCMPRGPCYQCLFPQAPPADAVLRGCDAGILGPIPGVIGTVQALETIKLIVGIGEPLVGRLLLFDGEATRFETIDVARDPSCPACGTGRSRRVGDDPLSGSGERIS